MKKLYTILSLLILLSSLNTYAQTYYTYTAFKSGNWSDNIWNITNRTDGVKKTKVIIGNGFTITADNGVNSLGLGDVDVVVSGVLKLASNTALVLGSNSNIQLLGTGNVDANSSNQTITIGSVVKYVGNKDKTKVGPAIADATTGASPIGFRSTSLLPVNFLSVSTIRNNDNVNIGWSVANEVNNNQYVVEKSVDGTSWKGIGFVLPSTSNAPIHQYEFKDVNAGSARIYYRIKQVDLDGAFTYSTVKTINAVANATTTNVFAASNSSIQVRFNTTHDEIKVNIISLAGQVFSQQKFSSANSLSVNTNPLPAGLYLVQMSDKNGWAVTEKIIVP